MGGRNHTCLYHIRAHTEADSHRSFTALFKEQERKNSPCLCNLHKSSGLWETLISHSTQGQGTWDLRAHVFLNHYPLMLMASTNIAETRSAVIRIPQNNPQLHAEWWEEEDRECGGENTQCTWKRLCIPEPGGARFLSPRAPSLHLPT